MNKKHSTWKENFTRGSANINLYTGSIIPQLCHMTH